MSRIPSSPDDLTPDWLATLLNQPPGSVESIQVEPVTGEYGKSHQLFILQVHYIDKASSVTAASAFPNRLFLKFGKSIKEPFFYQTIASAMPASTLLRCYYAEHNPEADRYCLLLEDRSATHFQTEWPIPPSASRCQQMVEELAKIHAAWWKSPRLEREFRPVLPPGRAWRDRRALAVEKLPDFIEFLGDRLAPPRRAIFERLVAAPTRFWEPSGGAPHQTLLHGDFHAWNVFFPRDPAGSLVFFDWNMWDIGLPTDDLAYMMAVHWFPERRQRLEQSLLQAYHIHLAACGISNYAWETFQRDYRESVIRSLFIPVWQWVRGIFPGVWWPHLERVFLAFEDLGCYELVENLI